MNPRRFKNYENCIEYLFNLERRGIKYNLDNIRKLSALCGNPEKKFRSIHIAGTNGKGSTASIINSALIEKGFKTGLYSSPHIRDFRERILINGKFISKKYIMDFVNAHCKNIERIKPSFFEVTTAMALSYFHSCNVDFAVIETGLGGRLDATNIITPVVSVITSIGIDHVEFLGYKLKHIAVEKAGIIKKKIPVIIGNIPPEITYIFKNASVKTSSEFVSAEKKFTVRILSKSEYGFKFRIKSKAKNKGSFFIPVTGDYQKHNIKTAFAALECISRSEKIYFTIPELKRAFKNLKSNSKLSGRFEMISKNPKIIIDVSHNAQALKNIKKNLSYYKYNKLLILFAMMSDKQYIESISILTELNASRIILTKPEYKRAALPEELYKAVKKKKEIFEINDSVKNSYEKLFKLSEKDDLILVTGSFFLVSDYLKIFRNRNH